MIVHVYTDSGFAKARPQNCLLEYCSVVVSSRKLFLFNFAYIIYEMELGFMGSISL